MIEKLEKIAKEIYVPDLLESKEGCVKNLLIINALNLIINELKQGLTLPIDSVVKPSYCLDEVHRGKKDRCKQQCKYCAGFS